MGELQRLIETIEQLNDTNRALSQCVTALLEHLQHPPPAQPPQPSPSVPIDELLQRLPDLLRHEGGYAEATCRAYARDFRAFCTFINRENGDHGHT